MDKVEFAKMLGLELVDEIIGDDGMSEWFFKIGEESFCEIAPAEYMAWDQARDRVVESIRDLVRV